MDQERWRQIEAIFHEASQVPVGEQGSFVQSKCRDDRDMERDVLDLLAAQRQDRPSLLDSTAIDLITSQIQAIRNLDQANANDSHDDSLDSSPLDSSSPLASTADSSPLADVHLRHQLSTLSEKYSVREVVGHGGMETVFRAVDRNLGREVAIKVTTAPHIESGQLVKMESARAAQIESPYIVTVHACEVGNQIPYLVMEYVEGWPLDRLISRSGRIPERLAAKIVQQTARGLEAVHTAGLIHGDVKASNFIVKDAMPLDETTAHVKLVDFGLAQSVNAEVGGHETRRVQGGTMAYMSRERYTAPRSGFVTSGS